MAQRRYHRRRRYPIQRRAVSSNTALQQQQQQQDEQLPDLRLLNQQQLNPTQVIQLQRMIGNRATQNLLIQRNQDDDIENTETASEVLNQIGGTGSQVSGGMLDPMMVNAPNSAPNQNVSLTGTQKAGAIVGIGADSLGFIANTMNTVTGSIKTNKAVKKKKQLIDGTRDSSGKSHKDQLDSRFKLADRRHSEGGKQVAEGVTGGLSNIFNIVNNSLQLAGSITNATANVLAGVGGGIGILTGFVGMIRDSMNIHKRGKAKKRIKGLINTYHAMANDEMTKMDADKSKIEGHKQALGLLEMRINLLKKAKQNASPEKLQTIAQQAQDIKQRVTDIGQEIDDIKAKMPDYEKRLQLLSKRVTALKLSKRKQGAGGKIASLIMNIGGMGVGTLAIIGAATGAAALGPVGWAIGGALFLTTIGIMVGKKIKQAIRASNVTRMKQEQTHVTKYVDDAILPPGLGKLTKKQRKKAQKTGGSTPESKYRYGVTGPDASPGYRKGLPWYRQFFTTDTEEKKGWFNKLFTRHDKKKNMSGVTKIGERQIVLTQYLERYDKDDAGATTFAGILSGLTTDEGELDVPNPKFDEKKPENPTTNPKNIKFRDHIKLMIKAFYPKKGDKIISDIIANADPQGDAKKEEILNAAKALILEKLKLKDK